MPLKCEFTDAIFKIGKTTQIKSVPIEILKLVNFTLENIDLSEKGFSEELLALAQPMMFNFCFDRDEKRRLLKKKRHDQSKESPFSLYVAIKIYSHSISDNRLLDITRDLAS